MLTRDQALKAAFYSGANLLSFTDERADNLDWMGARKRGHRHDVKRAADAVMERVPADLPPDLQADILVRSLADSIRVPAEDDPRRYSWVVFVTVWRACAALMAAERAAMEANLASAAPRGVAAGDVDPEDRIDALQPHPMARIDD